MKSPRCNTKAEALGFRGALDLRRSFGGKRFARPGWRSGSSRTQNAPALDRPRLAPRWCGQCGCQSLREWQSDTSKRGWAAGRQPGRGKSNRRPQRFGVTVVATTWLNESSSETSTVTRSVESWAGLRAARPQQHAMAVGVSRSDAFREKIAMFCPLNPGSRGSGIRPNCGGAHGRSHFQESASIDDGHWLANSHRVTLIV